MGNWARSTSWRNDWEWASDLLQSLVVFLGLNNSVVRVFDVFSPCRVVVGDREAGGHDSIVGCGHHGEEGPNTSPLCGENIIEEQNIRWGWGGPESEVFEAGVIHSLKSLGQDSALPAWHTGGTTATQIDYNGLR